LASKLHYRQKVMSLMKEKELEPQP
jgi:hypothetical protein